MLPALWLIVRLEEQGVVWNRALFETGRIAWNARLAGTKKVPGTYELMENPENHSEPCRLDPSRY